MAQESFSQDFNFPLAIDIRVEGLETDPINTASCADSSMLLVLRPLTIFEMKARASGTDDNGA